MKRNDVAAEHAKIRDRSDNPDHWVFPDIAIAVGYEKHLYYKVYQWWLKVERDMKLRAHPEINQLFKRVEEGNRAAILMVAFTEWPELKLSIYEDLKEDLR